MNVGYDEDNVSSGRTGMSDATQVVEDVVERQVGFFTCLGAKQ